MSPHRATAVMIGAALAAIAAAWAGCSVEKHYKTLSFFFDGVPDPNAPQPGSGGLFARAANVTYYIHQPFDEGTCQACHTDFSDLTLIRGNSTVCLSCHESTPAQYPRMHGPVAAASCLWCHEPHQSTVPHLLREDATTLCQRCHVARLLQPAHGGAPPEQFSACLECHSGHGGHAAYFLKDGAASMPPVPAAPEGP